MTGNKRARMLKRISKQVRLFIILILLVLVLLPIYWMVNTSFKPQNEIFKTPPTIFPEKATLSNYVSLVVGDLASSISFMTYFKNSLIVSVATVILTLILATPAAYAFSRVPFIGKKMLIYLIPDIPDASHRADPDPDLCHVFKVTPVKLVYRSGDSLSHVYPSFLHLDAERIF